VNEGLPSFVVDALAKQHPLEELTVGILGTAFKAESDDIRSSLAYKLKKLLKYRARGVMMTDPFVKDDPELRPLEEVVSKCDVFVLGVPHKAYKGLDLGKKPVVDVWNYLK
jgi:UDP-N-acetyl-D-mannosaminuronic acid dehydrogenase